MWLMVWQSIVYVPAPGRPWTGDPGSEPGMRGKCRGVKERGRKCGLEREMEVIEREEVSVILLRKMRRRKMVSYC